MKPLIVLLVYPEADCGLEGSDEHLPLCLAITLHRKASLDEVFGLSEAEARESSDQLDERNLADLFERDLSKVSVQRFFEIDHGHDKLWGWIRLHYFSFLKGFWIRPLMRPYPEDAPLSRVGNY